MLFVILILFWLALLLYNFLFNRSCSPSFRKPITQDDSNHGSKKRKARKPFHFRTIERGESPILSSTEAVPGDNSQEATYSRYKYYQRLRGPPQGDDTVLVCDSKINLIKLLSINSVFFSSFQIILFLQCSFTLTFPGQPLLLESKIVLSPCMYIYLFTFVSDMKMTLGIYYKFSFVFYSFAVWNTMMGTSLLSMPWAIEQAGLVAGLSIFYFDFDFDLT